MKIERIIDGRKVEIELTRAEINEAYFEAERHDDAIWIMNEWYDEDFMEDYGRPPLTEEEAMEIALDFEEAVYNDDHIGGCRYDIMMGCVEDYVQRWREEHEGGDA